ncbi:hypothetical protein XcuCFBP2542_12180 [Xanthomonas cucurbitae]|uniref:Uncharacterized protein n=1 Tax=Xanthomonas cucurbitae TaxID=56453 RepID=A0A2S7DQ82_9XANT|nr:hypothetical protein XcuCFBP2542_12180 [Xanthomonas cucurbitae]QHG85938.1 hypothetical protein EBN15_02070 [Xanthomonas cucurbitae]
MVHLAIELDTLLVAGIFAITINVPQLRVGNTCPSVISMFIEWIFSWRRAHLATTIQAKCNITAGLNRERKGSFGFFLENVGLVEGGLLSDLTT